MILDASDSCNDVNFNFGSGSSTSRSYDIKVTQYECGVNLGGEFFHILNPLQVCKTSSLFQGSLGVFSTSLDRAELLPGLSI